MGDPAPFLRKNINYKCYFCPFVFNFNAIDFCILDRVKVFHVTVYD